MGVRLTGISTPVGGVSWEYTKGAERSAPLSIFPRQKIQVFISSICGVEKYDKVRDELKTAIERTQLADVYTFESKEASTLPAGNHYTWALEDSDICIFLIDNTDGIKPGVQAEIAPMHSAPTSNRGDFFIVLLIHCTHLKSFSADADILQKCFSESEFSDQFYRLPHIRVPSG